MAIVGEDTHVMSTMRFRPGTLTKSDRTLARYAREHNGANVLALGSTLVTMPDALEIVDTFLGTPMREARYIRRLAKVRELERRQS